MSILVLLAIALAPGGAIVIYIYLKDKHEREPLSLLTKSFFYGFLSIILTVIISIPVDYVFPINETSLSEQAVHAFLLVALIEEFSKFVFVRWVLYPNSNFNEPFDGIVYSVMVGMGFATLENLIYVFDGGIGTGVFRMFTAVPAHATFAILMGYYLGKAKFEKKKSHNVYYALGAATLFHGAYDYFLFISFVPGIALGALASLVVGIWLSRKAIRLHVEASPFRIPTALLPTQSDQKDPDVAGPTDGA
jgi:RsiW-degrading membrane proteinase PrsW (M82 family)